MFLRPLVQVKINTHNKSQCTSWSKLAFALLVLLLCELMAPLWAAPVYPDFNPLGKDAVGVSPESFRRYIRPQIKSIIQEYYSILVKTGPHQEDLINLRRQIFALWAFIEEEKNQQINHQGPTGHDPFPEIYRKIKSIDLLILKIWPRLFREDEHALINVYATLLTRPLDLIASKTYQGGHYLENLLAFTPPPAEIPATLASIQQKFTYPMLLQAESILTVELDKELQENFDGVFRSFIYPLEKYLLTDQDRDYLLARVAELNMAWHSFHTKMVSHDYHLSMNTITTLAMIRNRWNSIMKLIVN